VCGEVIFFSEKVVLSSDLLGFGEKFMWQDSSRAILLPLRKKWLLYELNHHLPSDLVRNLKLTHLRPFAGSRYLEEHIRGTTAFDPLVGLVSLECVELPVFVPLVGLDGSITTSY
jgi:hypothetical protein